MLEASASSILKILCNTLPVPGEMIGKKIAAYGSRLSFSGKIPGCGVK